MPSQSNFFFQRERGVEKDRERKKGKKEGGGGRERETRTSCYGKQSWMATF
jgi:hypothetical protein